MSAAQAKAGVPTCSGGGGSWSEPQEAVSGLLSNRKALNGQHTGLVSRAEQSKWLYKVQV